MYGQTHAGLGWVIGVLPPSSDRRLRAWCTFAAILPDIDAGAILFGLDAYGRWHHKPGHNVFLGVACVMAAGAHFWSRPLRQRIVAVFLVAVCFASHILTDMKLSGWEVYLYWPFSERGYGFQPIWALGHPLNTWLAYIFMILPWQLAFWKPVTPLELVSPRLDRIFLNAFRKKSWACETCKGPCNNECDKCAKPTCMKHGRINWRFRITCPACALK
jgi:inner membrane protein